MRSLAVGGRSSFLVKLSVDFEIIIILFFVCFGPGVEPEGMGKVW